MQRQEKNPAGDTAGYHYGSIWSGIPLSPRAFHPQEVPHIIQGNSHFTVQCSRE